MKFKDLTPIEAMNLLLITGKPLPLSADYTLDGVNLRNKTFLITKNIGLKCEEECEESWCEIEIPTNGRNPAELTLAHLQMGENGHEYRLLEEGEKTKLPTDDIEYWNGGENIWLKYDHGQNKNVTYRTRKPKGYFLAIRFHETYERLAPAYGYETRLDTRAFDPTSKNGKLMAAVCAEILE